MKLQLTYPIKPLIISQKFGETAFLQYYKDNGVILPGHNGVDMAAIHGQPIHASHDGVATYEIDSKQGHGVVVRTNEPFDYEGKQVFFKTIYWHMVDPVKDPRFASPVIGKGGMQVKTGDVIGYVNSTGLSTGDHLHFGLKPCMPQEPEGWVNIVQNNGMYGAIDPTPYWNGKYAENTIVASFFTDMAYGQSSPEIMRLQTFLSGLGYFQVQPTGYYGTITQKAVYAFQLDYIYNLLSWYELYWLKGSKCGIKTRKALNDLINRT